MTVADGRAPGVMPKLRAASARDPPRPSSPPRASTALKGCRPATPGPYRKSLAWRQALADLGAVGSLTRAYRPLTSGKAERFHRTLLDEWACLRPCTGNTERTGALADPAHLQPPSLPHRTRWSSTDQPCEQRRGSLRQGPGDQARLTAMGGEGPLPPQPARPTWCRTRS